VTRRRLLRPAVLIPALVLLSLATGVGYALWTQLDASRIEANERILAALPVFPGAEEVDRLTRTTAEGAVPVPDTVTTTVLFAPPPGVTQADVVEFYVTALAPEWTARTTTVTAEDEEADAVPSTAFRVDFTRGADCVSLLTYGMAEGHIGDPSFALSAESGRGPCPEP
jgi:hypothetical protein